MSAEKSIRQNEIAVEMVKVLGDKEKTILLKFLDNILKPRRMPKIFLKSEIVVIPKNQKQPNAVITKLLVICHLV